LRVRQHVNPEHPFFEHMTVAPIALPPGRAIEVEIGCAEAQFLFERARLEPRGHYLGLEIRDRMVRRVNAAARAGGAPVRAVFCHANHHLARLFPAGALARVYLNFPDPWFKRRHRERRMIDAPLVAAIAHVLAPGGDVMVQSDVWAVALGALELFERHDDAFDNLAGGWSFWRGPHGFGARSWREAHCEEIGAPIWRLRFRRRGKAAQA
jgi:tRNA (guanine-N7-)-methyltransferase